MKNLLAPCLFTALLAGASACTTNDNGKIVLQLGQLRVANAITDSNPVDATVVGVPPGIDNIAFGTGSGLRDVPDGSYRVSLSTTTNAGNITFVADPVHVHVDRTTTVYAIGRMSQGSEATFVIEATNADVPADKTETQFVDAASQQAAPLDIYLTAPGASLVGRSPTAMLSFPSGSAVSQPVPGQYRVRVTPQGNAATVIFDSGPVGISLAAATSYQFALLDNSSQIPSPILLLVLNGSGGSFLIQNGGS